MRHIARAPRLLRVLVLILTAVVLTLEVRDGRMVDPRETTYVSHASSLVAEIDSAESEPEPETDRQGETGGQSVHCRYACLRAAVPRPRLDDLWPTALLVMGLGVGLPGSVRGGSPRAHPTADAAVTGGEILLRLCVCRR
ncbi:hypothetical protein [Nocardia sp. NBC_01329]|uniref:hypothetical protein n=1 Tax=Nocardia sp. NBC_01329 TaxID=2903594 RepID=UPI002E11D888|nr:hypothetical protein OG405_22260 [Nocardia sp. NBC_01329]